MTVAVGRPSGLTYFFGINSRFLLGMQNGLLGVFVELIVWGGLISRNIPPTHTHAVFSWAVQLPPPTNAHLSGVAAVVTVPTSLLKIRRIGCLQEC